MVPPLTRRLTTALGCLGLGVIGASYLYSQANPPSPSTPRAVIDQYCVLCHNDKLKTSGLMLDRLDIAHVGDHAEEWEKVVRKFRTGEMPPPGLPRPDPATYAKTTAQLEAVLDAAAAPSPTRGGWLCIG